MAHRPVNFDGGIFASDSANTYGAAVERDASGNILVSGVGSTGLAISTPVTGATIAPSTTITGTATLTTAPIIQRLDASGGAFTTTLPPASTSAGQIFIFIRVNATNLPTIKGNGSETINGANTYTGLSAQYATAIFWTDGTSWWGGKLA